MDEVVFSFNVTVLGHAACLETNYALIDNQTTKCDGVHTIISDSFGAADPGWSASLTPAPEPGGLLCVALGVMGLVGLRFRQGSLS